MEILLQPDRLQPVDLRLLHKQIGGWRTGVILSALVEKLRTPHMARLRVNGSPVTVTSATPLRTGEQLQLKVDQTRPLTKLVIVSRQPGQTAQPVLPALLRTHLPVAVTADKLTQNLRMVMASLAI